jgi:copper chaperone CopZ
MPFRSEICRFIASLLLLFTAFSLQGENGFSWVEVGVNGLTCSQCTRSVEMSIRKLEFVEDVQMDLEHTNGKITFKKGAQVSIDRIAQAVIDAGFSVRFLKAGFFFDNLVVSDNYCYAFLDDRFKFVKTAAVTLNGEKILQFLGDKFLSKSESKKWKPFLKDGCGDKKQKTYFVTL